MRRTILIAVFFIVGFGSGCLFKDYQISTSHAFSMYILGENCEKTCKINNTNYVYSTGMVKKADWDRYWVWARQNVHRNDDMPLTVNCICTGESGSTYYP